MNARANQPATRGALRGLLFLGACCLLIGLGLIVSDVQSRHRDADFRECLADVVTDQNEVLERRGALVERESQATQNIIRNVFEASTREETLKAYRQYLEELEAVEKARKNNPIPGLPEGVCR